MSPPGRSYNSLENPIGIEHTDIEPEDLAKGVGYNSLENPIGIETLMRSPDREGRTQLQLIRKPDRLKHLEAAFYEAAALRCYNSLENPIGLKLVDVARQRDRDTRYNSLENLIGIETSTRCGSMSPKAVG